MSNIDREYVERIGKVLGDPEISLKERFRALFTLKNLGGKQSIEWIARGFTDPSALLKHELAYCLGQMKDPDAIDILRDVLSDRNQEPMVRHEAGEALGAIGTPEVIDILEKYVNDPDIEVAETCQLALARINWLEGKTTEDMSKNPYGSVDPAPPLPTQIADIESLGKTLLDVRKPLFDRYRAMFALRNNGSKEAVLTIAKGLKCPSSMLFRHEIAFVLGQMQSPDSIPQLIESLENVKEHAMVRHESAEALGAIATPECMAALEKYAKDNVRVIRESCQVALDMAEYETGPEFQYANTFAKMKSDVAA